MVKIIADYTEYAGGVFVVIGKVVRLIWSGVAFYCEVLESKGRMITDDRLSRMLSIRKVKAGTTLSHFVIDLILFVG